MILLALALTQTGPAIPPPPASNPRANEMTIAARKLHEVEFGVTLDRKGRVKDCRVSKGIGDPAFDGFWCEAAHACSDEGQISTDAMKACLKTREEEFLAALNAKYPGGRTPPATGK
jgi:hypothetical protein